MPIITLPDGSNREYSEEVTVIQVAADIGAGLAKATVAGKVNGQLVDASDLIQSDASLQIITMRDEDGLHIMRHTCAHLLGHAIKQLYPNVQMAIGPVVDNGFYYDVDSETPITESDLAKIQKRMTELAKTKYAVVKKMTSREDALKLFKERGEDYKIELIKDMPDEIQFGFYHHEEYVDMCRGPHLPNMGFVKAFKLTHVAGAYWRGDSSKKMLQRIYGVAFANKQDLKDYLHMMEEAEKRDHRKLGKLLNLFHVEESAPGMAFWHAKGTTLYQVVENYMRQQLAEHDYDEVRTPLKEGEDLWWIDNNEEDVRDLSVKLWGNLSTSDKNKLKIKALAFFPGLLGVDPKKYARLATWLVSRFGIVNHALRDTFSAGGQVLITGIKLPKIFEHIVNDLDKILEITQTIPEEDIKHYWKIDLEEKNPNEVWIEQCLIHCKTELNDKQFNVIKKILNRCLLQ